MYFCFSGPDGPKMTQQWMTRKTQEHLLRRGPLLRTLTGNHSASFVAKSAAVIETIHQEVLAEVGRLLKLPYLQTLTLYIAKC